MAVITLGFVSENLKINPECTLFSNLACVLKEVVHKIGISTKQRKYEICPKMLFLSSYMTEKHTGGVHFCPTSYNID